MVHRVNDLSVEELLALVVRPPDRETFAAATAELVTRHRSLVYGLSLRIAGHDPSLADDIFQDTFIRMFKWLGKRKGHAPLRTFPRLLATFAKRAAIDQVRKRRAEHLDETLIEATTQDLADVLYAREIMEELDERSQEILKLAFFEGLETTEIAAQLGLKTGTVRVLKHRALRRLRDQYQSDNVSDSLEKL